MENKLSDKILTEPQRLWLETIYLKLKNNEVFNKKTLRIELLEKLPKGFEPNDIDGRLLRGGLELTLLGTALINPKSNLVYAADKIIHTINKLIKENSDIDSITSETIAHLTKIPEKDVGIVLQKLAETGFYHSHGLSRADNIFIEITIDERAFKGYLEYPNITECLQTAVENIKNRQLEAVFKKSPLNSPAIEERKTNKEIQNVSKNVSNEQKKQSNKLQKYGNWEITDNLSGGFQGTTYCVKRADDVTGKIFVLKSLKDLRAINRFKTEINAGLKLEHPNILKIIDSDIEAKKPFLVSESCSGGTLKHLNISNLTILDKLKIFLQISDAVGFAHSNKPQIIHRDLKPENIFFKEDGKTPVVGDFGICFIDDNGDRVTLIDEAVGARKYTAPELEEGRNDSISPAADVYSLGKILYWMLAGKIFDREKHRNENWNLEKDSKESATVFIYELLDKMIAQYPEERLKDANEVASHIKNIIQKIIKNAHPLDFNAPQECLYCGVGFYDKFLEADHEHQKKQFPFASAMHFVGYDKNKWQMASIILVCDNCGNEQRFRPFYKGWENGKWKGLLPEGIR